MRPHTFRALLMAWCVSISPLAAADTIQMIGANVDLPGGVLVLRGSPERGFTFTGPSRADDGIWSPTNCNSDPQRCKPGDVLSLFFFNSGGDLNGTATLDGVTYTDIGAHNSSTTMSVQFTGSVVLPPMGPPTLITAPFVFTGVFMHAANGTGGAREDLTGRGTAVISLRRHLFFPGSWHIDRVRYTLAQLPEPWQSAEVGAVGTPGYAFQGPDGDLFMAGAGSDIWGAEDSFRFVYQPLQSDGDILALAGQETRTDGFAKLGVMIRQSLDPGAPHVILDVKPDGGVEFMTRATPGGQTTFVAGSVVPVTPVGGDVVDIGVALRLSRIGNTVTAMVCREGSCETIGTTSWVSGPALIGVAVTSHDPSRLNEASFRSMPTVMTSELPSPWHLTDVGDVGLPGQASRLSGIFTVSAAGADIWGAADSFSAVTQPVSANAMVTARVLDEQDTHTFAKAGITMGGLSPSSARVVLDVKPDGGIEFMVRQADGGVMEFRAGTGVTFPVSLRLTRSDTIVDGAISSDGEHWTPIGTVAVSFGSGVEAGLAVTSHDTSVRNTARFDRVLVFGSGNAQNLLVNPGFEESTIPALGPGWISDPQRESAAQTETAQPNSGAQNAACRTSESVDCGIFQELTIPSNGFYVFAVRAAADKAGALVGVNINGVETGQIATVTVGGYRTYRVGFVARAGDLIRVWAYSPAAPGTLAIDDASVVLDTGPH